MISYSDEYLAILLLANISNSMKKQQSSLLNHFKINLDL
jgi:hypothetical protein